MVKKLQIKYSLYPINFMTFLIFIISQYSFDPLIMDAFCFI